MHVNCLANYINVVAIIKSEVYAQYYLKGRTILPYDIKNSSVTFCVFNLLATGTNSLHMNQS